MAHNFTNIPDIEKYYNSIINNVPGAMIVFGVDDGMLHVRYVSDNCVKISGFTAEETYERAKDNPVADAFPEDRDKFASSKWDDGREHLSFTYRIICKDGNYKWVHLALSKVIENDEVLYYGVFSDVDEEHKRNEAQREKELLIKKQQKAMQDMYQSILDETQAMITIIDAETFEVVYANKKATDMSGVDGYIGCTCYRGIHKSDTPCQNCLILKEDSNAAETKVLTYAHHAYRMIKKPIIWNKRKALLEYSEDITEQQRLQKAEIALEAEKKANIAKTQFLSRVSHDMRTPLNGILGMTTLLKDRISDNDLLLDLSEVEMSGHYLLELINDTLDMSRIESGKLELQPMVYEGQSIIDNAINLAKASMHGRDLNLVVDIDKIPFILLYIDTNRLNQVVMNLVGNAVKFTPDGGTIEISLQSLGRENGTITGKLMVKDTGVGISSEFIPYIFEAFSQENTSKTGITQGTGLGMAITKRIVELMGGEISVESEQGKGTCFTVIIKMNIATEEQIAGWKKSNSISDITSVLAGKRILLCEDHPLNAKITTRLLNVKGITVEHAVNGLDGLNMFRASKPQYYDAILMDIRMPVMDGLDAAKEIRKCDHPDAKKIPIIAMTANAFSDDIAETKAAGMNEHLSKPIQTEVLYQTLLSHMHRC